MVHNQEAGILQETDDRQYIFTYNDGYCGDPVCLAMPVRKESYHSSFLFPYFFNMLSEGANQRKLKEELDKQKENKDQNQDQNDQKQPPLSEKAKQVQAQALQQVYNGNYEAAKKLLEDIVSTDETAGQLSPVIQRVDDLIEINAGRRPKKEIDASNTDNELEVI